MALGLRFKSSSLPATAQSLLAVPISGLIIGKACHPEFDIVVVGAARGLATGTPGLIGRLARYPRVRSPLPGD